MEQRNRTALSLFTEPRMYSGYIQGYRQPVGLITLQVASINVHHLNHLSKALKHYLTADLLPNNAIQTAYDVASYFSEGLSILQKMAGLPVFEAPIVEQMHRKKNVFLIWIPTLHKVCLSQTIALMLELFNHSIHSTSFLPEEKFLDKIQSLVKRLKVYAPKGLSTLKLLEEAYLSGIAWSHVAHNTFQYGYGINSRWFDGTFTDKTSRISAVLARNKLCTSMLLLKAGLPVPEQYAVNNKAEAVLRANKIGYPVVIKPLNQDNGNGVFSMIMSDKMLLKAYQNAYHFSPIVLLEKHIVGKDYRLLVLNGQLIWAIERIPAGVTGDGVSSISSLIQDINQQRNNTKHTSLCPIEVTDDTIDFLAEQGLDLTSVPESGQFIPVNRIANISTGGTPASVFDKVHPDNKKLVEMAAKLLRLDIAGVDFISSNIEQSYLETGGKIIEVNAQPQLGVITTSHIYAQVLSTLMSNKGRIPIIVICSHDITESFIQDLKFILLKHCINIGVAKDNTAYINNKKIVCSQSLFDSGLSLLMNTDLDALIYCITYWDEIDRQGLPFDRYDTLLFLDAPLVRQDRVSESDYLMNSLIKACYGDKIIRESSLAYIMKYQTLYGYKMILVLSEVPFKMHSYPDFIEMICYLNDQKRLVTKWTSQNRVLSKQNKLMLSLIQRLQ
jgi:cyanophycin synthetase